MMILEFPFLRGISACAIFRLYSLAALVLGLCVLIILLSTALADELEYRLGTGDLLKITVFGHKDLSGQFEVDGVGRISFPLIRQVMALDLTIKELEAVITDKLKPDFLIDPQVNVEVLNYRPFYIIGEVREPGSYSYVNGMTVLNAIALAGGFTYRANKDKVVLIRADDNGKEKKVVNQETPILPGDIIEVPERFF